MLQNAVHNKMHFYQPQSRFNSNEKNELKKVNWFFVSHEVNNIYFNQKHSNSRNVSNNFVAVLLNLHEGNALK